MNSKIFFLFKVTINIKNHGKELNYFKNKTIPNYAILFKKLSNLPLENLQQLSDALKRNGESKKFIEENIIV